MSRSTSVAIGTLLLFFIGNFGFHVLLFHASTCVCFNSRQSSESPKLIMPTIFTVLISLILFICVLFVSYCVCILFCYLSKRGLFRKPKILIISEQSSTSTNYDEANSNDPTANNSPKHSTGSCTSSCSSSSCSSYSHRRSKPTTSSSYHYHNRPRSTHRPTSGQTSSSYRATSSAAGAAARQPQSQRSSSYRPTSSTSSSSTTRAGNSSRPSQCRQKHNRTSVPSTSQSRASTSARSSSQLYAEPECYVDFDTDSPFLIPTSHATQKPNSRSKRTRSSPTRRRSGQTSSSRSHSSQQTRVSETAGMISGEHQLETIHSAIASSRSSVSLDFGAPLMETVEIAAAESGIVLSNNSINQGTNIQSSSHMIMMSSYYQDEEKPPSYDEIIRNSSSVAPN